MDHAHPDTSGSTGRRIDWAAAALLVLPLLFITALFFAPLGYTGIISLEDTRGRWAAYQELWNEKVYWVILVRTFRTAIIVALACVALAFPVAYMLTRLRGLWRAFAFWCVLFPLWMSALARTFSWMLLLDKNGPVASLLIWLGLADADIQILYTSTAVYLGMVHVMLPFAVFPIYSSLSTIDWRLIAASDGLGASPLRTFLHVYFPLSLPGVLSAGALVFLISLGFFVTPAMLGGLQHSTLASLIEMLIHERFATSTAAAASIVLLGLTLALALASSRIARRFSTSEGGHD